MRADYLYRFSGMVCVNPPMSVASDARVQGGPCEVADV